MPPALTYQAAMSRTQRRDACPEYEAVSRSHSNATSESRDMRWVGSDESSSSPRSVNAVLVLFVDRHLFQAPTDHTSPTEESAISTLTKYSQDRRLSSSKSRKPIIVEPSTTASPSISSKKCTFRLSVKANGIERVICDPTVLRLSSQVDPKTLEFVVFVYPGKSSTPAGCLWSLRIWLRVNGVDHRVFADDELWVGKDLDFLSVAHASTMMLRSVDPKSQIYYGYVGRALVTFICRWYRVNENLYKYTIDYDAGGVGGSLVEDLRLRIDGDPRTVTFHIYAVPIDSIPAGSTHRIRIWTKSLVSMSASDPPTLHPFQDSYIYQRIYKNDMFKIGAQLDFESMSSKATMGFAVGGVQTVVMSTSIHASSPTPLNMGGSSSSSPPHHHMQPADGKEVTIAVNPRKEDGKVYLADWKVKLGEEKIEVGDLVLWRGHLSGLRHVEWREALKAEPEGTITLLVQ
ncbi:hypothetical protein H0H92_004397 [Tricholoma furcatifolium]|nr:hypothetical protein H0H92_004397 [Tricholoma furcatifolium]